MSEGATFYFGTSGQPGHLLHPERGQRFLPYKGTHPLPWDEIDGALNPRGEREGECALHHKDGWTALAFANRTDDSRPGSNSVFFFKGTLGFEQAVAEARARWPRITERFAFDLTPHPTHERARAESERLSREEQDPPCPGCGGYTDDPAGGPCSICWQRTDEAEHPSERARADQEED